jgi:hypothetical protein
MENIGSESANDTSLEAEEARKGHAKLNSLQVELLHYTLCSRCPSCV